MKLNTKGFSTLEGLLILVIIGIIGFAGWKVWDAGKQDENSQTEVTQHEQQKQETETPDPNEGYLVVKEWGLRFKTPSGLSDVRYVISGDKLAFFAKPTGSSVQYRADYDEIRDGSFSYATGVLYRSKDATKDRPGGSVAGKKVGDYYYYTAWSFSSLASGAACVELYGDSSEISCQENGKAFQLVNQGDTALLNTIDLAQ